MADWSRRIVFSAKERVKVDSTVEKPAGKR
jgi:hypothetical protein